MDVIGIRPADNECICKECVVETLAYVQIGIDYQTC